MTKEELKQESKEYADKYSKSNFDLWDTARFAYYQSAEPREKRIAELTEQNTSLLTSVENLNKSVQTIENNLTKAKKLIKEMNEYLSTEPQFWGREEKLKIVELSYRADEFSKYGTDSVCNKDDRWHIIADMDLPKEEQVDKFLLIKMESVVNETEYAYLVFKYNGDNYFIEDIAGVIAWKEIE